MKTVPKPLDPTEMMSMSSSPSTSPASTSLVLLPNSVWPADRLPEPSLVKIRTAPNSAVRASRSPSPSRSARSASDAKLKPNDWPLLVNVPSPSFRKTAFGPQLLATNRS